MIYDFAGKIVQIKRSELLNEEIILSKTTREQEGLQSCKVLLSGNMEYNVLLKAQASVNSLSRPAHGRELSDAVDKFKEFLEAAAFLLEGEVSKAEGFYNNSTEFHKLY